MMGYFPFFIRICFLRILGCDLGLKTTSRLFRTIQKIRIMTSLFRSLILLSKNIVILCAFGAKRNVEDNVFHNGRDNIIFILFYSLHSEFLRVKFTSGRYRKIKNLQVFPMITNSKKNLFQGSQEFKKDFLTHVRCYKAR